VKSVLQGSFFDSDNGTDVEIQSVRCCVDKHIFYCRDRCNDAYQDDRGKEIKEGDQYWERVQDKAGDFVGIGMQKRQ